MSEFLTKNKVLVLVKSSMDCTRFPLHRCRCWQLPVIEEGEMLITGEEILIGGLSQGRTMLGGSLAGYNN